MTITALLVSVGVGTCAYVEGADKAPPVVIVGTVVDAGRQPAAGAGVYFSTHGDGGGWGRVVAQSEADNQGRFRLEIPATPAGRFEPGILWAYRPGALAATHRITGETPADEPVSMVLDHPARAEILVRGPDGRPLAGARIQPRALHHDPFTVPDGLAERIEDRTVTDDRGRAVLSAFFPEEINTVYVSAPGLGRQYFSLDLIDGKPEARAVDLRPVGRVEGMVVADDPEIAANRKLAVLIFDRRRGVPALGLFYLRTDPRGRFAIPEVPIGSLSISGMPPAGSPWYLRSPSNLKVEAGKTTRVEVEVVKGVRLRGLVRERGTGAPIAGAEVSPYRPEGSEDAIVRTDAGGRFTLIDRAGYRPNIMVSPPEGFAFLMFGPRIPRIPERIAEFELPPIELSRAGTVRGLVVDERGEPVPGAAVRASWLVNERPNASGRQERRATAGTRGDFRIVRVDAEAPVVLSAVAPDGRQTTQGVGSMAGAEPVRLVLESSTSTSLAGRVADASGRRVAGAKVRIRVLVRYPGGQIKGDALIEIRGAYAIKTNNTGWFRTPMILDPELEYAALVDADGFEPARTAWVAGKARTFPELVLRPLPMQGPATVDAAVLEDASRVGGSATR